MRLWLLAVCLLPLVAADYDLLIRNARVVDGSGNPWFRADVAVAQGRVAAVGRLTHAQAKQVIDAQERVLAPGFIDVHTHVETSLPDNPAAENYLRDGVTTLVTGNCGLSETGLPAFFGKLRQTGIGPNLATLIGHNDVRRAIIGDELRAPNADELAKMEALVEQAMRDGAVGLSTGLIYVPGTYAKTDEIVRLARVAAKYDGVYATHMRNEGDRILAAMDEAANIGREAGCRVEISHLKVSDNLANMDAQVLARLEQYRREGLDVVADQYPYPASSTTLVTMIPSWAQAGGPDAMRERLTAPETRAKIAAEMKEGAAKRGRTDLQYVAIANHPADKSVNGLRVPEISKRRGRAPGLDSDIQTVLDLLSQPGRTSVIYFSWSESGVETILRHPLVAVASDGGVQVPGPTVPHPRAYGTNARVLGLYAREKALLPLEDAIRKMTSLPAQTFRLQNRGLLRPGFAADLVLFDPAEVKDRSTYEQPHQFSSGFAWVWVNGVAVIAAGQRTAALPGEILRHQAAAGR